MTESTVVAAPAAKSSFWEDVIDIFVSPAGVFRRRQNSSIWPPMLFVAIAIGVIVFATFNTLQPMIDAEFSRKIAKALANNPQAAQASEAASKMRGFTEGIGKFAAGPVMLITMFILGSVAWLVGKMFGSKQTYQA